MKHLIICREYPPAPLPAGGIGTYVLHISRLLAESGEVVHVIGRLWEGAEKEIEEKCHGRLIIHRVPLEGRTSLLDRKPGHTTKSDKTRALFESGFYPQSFSWLASLLAESLIEEEGIDLIEAQDYEAPLYYFQVRRALGLGPKRYPPCIVHLHSPMEFIAQYNDWDINQIYLRTAKRLEDYSIAAADALLCPSRYLARQAEAHYGLTAGSIRVIPLPIGDSPLIERDIYTWEHGTILYLGRLERRKGIIEWIDAAVSVAYEYPEARFEFVGTNCLGTDEMSGEEFVERRIPKDLRMRFNFHGEQKRSSLPRFLKQARIAVVPSRWENFPNTCVEAMCSGLPVIASREGGMAEIIEDGRTGWLTRKTGSEGLTEALKRALETPSTKIVEMAHEASVAIRQICDNTKILENHLNFRSQIVNKGSKRSLHLPMNLPWARRPISDESARRTSQSNPQGGLAIVITCLNNRQLLDKCLQSIKYQIRKPAAVVIVDGGLADEQAPEVLNQALKQGWQVIHNRYGGIASAKNAGIEAILGSGLNPLGFAFLSAKDRLYPDFVAVCESVLQQCPEVGLVSCWVYHPDSNKTLIRPCPSFPYQWLSNEAVPLSVVRTEALREAGNFRLSMSQGYDDWDLFNAVMATGWIAVTIPEILADYPFMENPIRSNTNGHAYVRMRKELLERFPDLVARDAKDIVLLAESDRAWLQYGWSLNNGFFTLGKQLALARMILRRPRRTALLVLGKVKSKILRRTPIWMSSLISRVTG